MGWIAPSEFWRLHPDEFWWLYQAKMPPELLVSPDEKWGSLYAKLG